MHEWFDDAGQQDVVMGELSLSGRIYGVGAVREKAAALPAWCQRFLYPVDNMSDVADYAGPLELLPIDTMDAVTSITVRGEASGQRLPMMPLPMVACLTLRACARPCADGPNGIPQPAHDLAEATMVLPADSTKKLFPGIVTLLAIEACVVPGTGQASHVL
jgi:hypothetical protein